MLQVQLGEAAKPFLGVNSVQWALTHRAAGWQGSGWTLGSDTMLEEATPSLRSSGRHQSIKEDVSGFGPKTEPDPSAQSHCCLGACTHPIFLFSSSKIIYNIKKQPAQRASCPPMLSACHQGRESASLRTQP